MNEMIGAKLVLGFAMTGSYCTFDRALEQIEALKAAGAEVIPILSQNAYTTDTRFGDASEFNARIAALTGHSIIHDIRGAEPIGPKKLLDALLIMPCTGNTLGKLAGGITDTSVTMAAKAQIRNGRPLIIAVSTNDALGASAKNIGLLLNQKQVYFVPMRQDDAVGKPCSVVADFSKALDTVWAALEGRQLQPILG